MAFYCLLLPFIAFDGFLSPCLLMPARARGNRARGGASRAAAARAQFPSLPNPFGGGEGDAVPTAAPARAAPPSNPAWRGTVLDESLPDPVFDDTYEYKGRSKVGFVTYAELLNARMAMMGFTTLGMLMTPRRFMRLKKKSTMGFWYVSARPAYTLPRTSSSS